MVQRSMWTLNRKSLPYLPLNQLLTRYKKKCNHLLLLRFPLKSSSTIFSNFDVISDSIQLLFNFIDLKINYIANHI